MVRGPQESLRGAIIVKKIGIMFQVDLIGTLGWPIKPKMLKIKNVPIGCGSIGIDEQKTLKNYILSFKIQPALSGYIIQRKFLKIQRKNSIFNKMRF